MNNTFLEYLLDTDPTKVIGPNGIAVRKAISPIVRAAASKMGPYQLQIDELRPAECDLGGEPEPKLILDPSTPVIYAPTHGFKDDFLYTLLALGVPAYVLFGSLPQFFHTFDGISAWLSGVLLVDRSDSASRAAVVPKLVRALKLGSNVIVFPEGVWNKKIATPVLDLFPGIYQAAKESGAFVVPVATHFEGNICYFLKGEPFDITRYDQETGLKVLRDKMAGLKWQLIEDHSKASRDSFRNTASVQEQWNDFRGKTEIERQWDEYIESLIAMVSNYDRAVEDTAAFDNERLLDSEIKAYKPKPEDGTKFTSKGVWIPERVFKNPVFSDMNFNNMTLPHPMSSPQLILTHH